MRRRRPEGVNGIELDNFEALQAIVVLCALYKDQLVLLQDIRCLGYNRRRARISGSS